MSRLVPSKPGTSMGARSPTRTQRLVPGPQSRLGTATSRVRNSSSSLRQSGQPEIRPAQVHELKLQTQQIKQQTTVLRTQLKRTEFQINHKTSAINKTFEQSTEKAQTSATIHATTIPNIKRNIEGARNTLKTLKEQIDQVINDDKTSNVEELEEEVKMTYCEYKRLCRVLQDKKAEASFYDKQLEETEFRASAQHASELKAAIRDTRAENATLRDKANAYQIKIEKIDIEAKIHEEQKKKSSEQAALDNVEIEEAEQNQKMKKLCEDLNKEMEQHEQNVAELTEIIEQMKQKISDRLTSGRQEKIEEPVE